MIKKILVANRGEIAARVFRTAHDLGIATVAVFSDVDADLPYVALADEAVRLPGAAPADTYLRSDALIAAAKATGADAVHPGYGFLSENAGFASDCAAAGLTFVGPSPDAIASMGSKTRAKALMDAAGVPVLPGVTVEPGVDIAAAAERIGFPVLVKATFGGGGRGMRIVENPAELAEAVDSARREAASAFGDGTVFLERYVVDPRHVEVQILGDAHGNVVALFERDCSIQRRHQKIVEECPSPVVDDGLRAELSAAAVAAGKAIGYTGAGTVEFVMDGAGSFWFLEVNTRLQVEHPVTELVTGLDLVELQLRIAEGAPLPSAVTHARIDGHAIEVRLYAEDVPAGFLPATGTVYRFAIAAAPGIRVDAGVADGSVVGPHYDPMLAKVIAHGATRADAARRLARALRGARIHGVTTNRDLLLAILDDADFLAGRYVRLAPLVRTEPVDPVRAAAAALAESAAHRGAAPVLATLPTGWRNVAAHPQQVAYTAGEQTVEVAYRFARFGIDVRVDGKPLAVVPVSVTADRVVVEIEGVRRAFDVNQTDAALFVDDAAGSATLTRVPRFPDPDAVGHAGSLLAPMPGSVVRVAAEVGATVTAGQALVVLEAMKMEHTVAAPLDGVLTALHVGPGDQVESGQPLAVVEVPE